MVSTFKNNLTGYASSVILFIFLYSKVYGGGFLLASSL